MVSGDISGAFELVRKKDVSVVSRNDAGESEPASESLIHSTICIIVRKAERIKGN